MRWPAVLLLGAGFTGGAPPEVATLFPGTVVEREIQPQEAHRFRIEIQTDEYAGIEIEQKGVDVLVAASGPDGVSLVEADSPTDRFGSEVISIVATAGGWYGLEVRSLHSWQAAGSYRLGVREVRPATADDAKRAEAERLASSGYLLTASGRPADIETAAGSYRRALGLARELGDATLESDLRYRLALALFRLGETAAALAELETVLTLQRAAPGGADWRTLNLMGRVHRSRADSTRAQAAFAEALAACERSGGEEQAAPIHNNLGLLHHQEGKPAEALASYSRALALYQRAGDQRNEANARNNLGAVYALLGRSGEALEQYRTALDLARRVQRKDLEANVLNSLGDTYSATGQPRQALEAFSQALDLFREGGDVPRQAAVLNNLGFLLLELGAAEEGREMLLQALQLQREPRALGRTQLNLGRAARDLGLAAEALQWFARAQAQLRDLGDRAGEAQALFFLGVVHLDLAEPGKAKEVLDQALPIFRSLDDRFWQQAALRLQGRLHAALGDGDAASRSFADALVLGEALGDPREQGRTLLARSRVELDRGALEAARRDAESALTMLESLRAAVGSERLRASFLAAVHEAYAIHLEILMRLHEVRPGEGFGALALAAAERSRSRSLLDFLARSEIESRRGHPDLLAEEHRLREALAAKAARRMEIPAGDETGEAAGLEQEIESLAVEHRLVEARLRAGDPRYAALREPVIDAAAIQRLLDDETVLLEYALGETRSWLWVVTPAALSVFELPGRERIEPLVRRVHDHLRSPGPGREGDERADLEELSRLLLGSALDGLEGKRLAVVADGALHYIPFAALPVAAPEGGQVPLVVRHEVVHLPSAAVLREIRRAAAGRPLASADLAILADPVYEGTDSRVRSAARPAPADPIPKVAPAASVLRPLGGGSRDESLSRLAWSRREAERIAATADGKTVRLALDFEASRDLALSPELAGYRALHFATHGFLDADHPELSGLALSQWDGQGRRQDGFLRLQDVYGLRLKADLVVLSGCETALGKRIHGEGLLGLTHGFLHAGASQVVASLWKVRDRATAELMERFYRALLSDGLRPAAALRRAQVEMWSQRSWRDPYYWAAFTLQGDWRAYTP